jgi:hypothetical protein
MQLTGGQLKEFIAVIEPAFSLIELKVLVSSTGKNYNAVAPTDSTYLELVTAVVIRANSEGWVHLLIKEALIYRDAKPILNDFFENNPDVTAFAQTKHYADPYEAEWLDNGQVFLGRKSLRRHVRVCGTNKNPRGILINQDPTTQGKCGKSFSREFINFIADKQGSSQKVIYVDLDEFDYTFLELANRIADDMGLDRTKLPTQDGEQPVRWARRLARKILEQCRKLQVDTWWIILDGFRVRAVQQDTFAFIDHLAEAVFFDQKHARLALINFDKDRKECNSKQYETLPIDLASPPSQTDVYEFFAKIYPSNNRGHDRDKEQEERKTNLQKIVSEVFAQTDQQVKKDVNQKLSYYDWLNIATARAAKNLLAEEVG